MRKINSNIDENKLWRLCFPHFLPRSEAQGVYVIAPEEVTRQRYQEAPFSELPLEKAQLRLELACGALWGAVEQLFVCDFFPHLLAAATDILRAVDFGDEADADLAPRIRELVDALNECELICARLDRSAPPREQDEQKLVRLEQWARLSRASEEKEPKEE